MAEQPATTSEQPMKISRGRRRVMFFVFEENEFIEEIQASHSHDPAFELDLAPILSVIHSILRRSNFNFDDIDNVTEGNKDSVSGLEKMKTGSLAASPDGKNLEPLAAVIQKVSYEFCCNCTGDIHRSTMAMLNILGSYSWDAKVVIALAAFAVSYGELWLVILLGMADHPLAKSLALLKQTPDISQINGFLERQFDVLNDLIEVIVDVVKILIKFKLISSKSFSSKDDAVASQIATATYWSIRSIIACGAHISGIAGATSRLKNTTEAWDLTSLVHKERSIHDQLVQLLSLFNEFTDGSNSGRGAKRVSVYEFSLS